MKYRTHDGKTAQAVLKMENTGFEIIKEAFSTADGRRHVLMSSNRDLTLKDVRNSMKLHNEGKCDCLCFQDEAGWLYDFRHCVVCGKGLGLI